jgi:hypothetical protein
MKEVISDLFNISSRLRQVDKEYKIFLINNKFEVRKRGEICFVVPFDELDYRTIEYARKTRIENFEDLIEEMDEHNRELEKSATREVERVARSLFRRLS